MSDLSTTDRLKVSKRKLQLDKTKIHNILILLNIKFFPLRSQVSHVRVHFTLKGLNHPFQPITQSDEQFVCIANLVQIITVIQDCKRITELFITINIKLLYR